MAWKHAKNAGLLIPDALRPAAWRYLPASVQVLLLPALVRQVATGKHIDPIHRDAAHAVFVRWAEKLALGQLHGLTETQVEADFTGGLLAALGYVSAAGSTTEFTMLPKWAVPGVGSADAALGLFRFDPDGKPTGHPRVVCELKGAGKPATSSAATPSSTTPTSTRWPSAGACGSPASSSAAGSMPWLATHPISARSDWARSSRTCRRTTPDTTAWPISTSTSTNAACRS